MTCVSNKRSFADQQLALEALIQYHIRNEFTHDQGPINVYQCTDCGNWHFTSKGEKADILNQKETIEQIKRERRAYQWEQKLR